MQCLRCCAAALLLLAVAFAGGAAAGAGFVSGWLNDPDLPDKAVAIVVLGGDPSRALEAADLYRAGYAPRIYVIGPVREPREQRLDAVGVSPPREETLTRRVLAVRGVPEGAVELLGRDLVSTAHEAKAAAERLTGVSGTLIVVTSPAHIRRARMVFRDAMPDRSLRFVASRYEALPRAWWRDQAAARSVVLEIAKTMYYLAGGRF